MAGDVDDAEDDGDTDLTASEEEREQERALSELAQGMDEEERTTAQETDPDDNIEEDDEIEGWVDKVEELSSYERCELQHEIQPVKLVLAEVSASTCRISINR